MAQSLACLNALIAAIVLSSRLDESDTTPVLNRLEDGNGPISSHLFSVDTKAGNSMKMIEMMRRVFLSLFLVQAAISAAHAQGLAPIAITGFNSDIVANGTGSAASTTSVAADLFDTVLVSRDWKANGSSTALDHGLPVDGIVSNTDGSYRLQSYSGNNDLRLSPNVGGTLTLSAPTRYSRLSLLGFGGQGAVTLTATINFQDGTSAVFAGITLEDWFYASPYVVNALGRVYRSTSVSEFDGSNPRLYAADINLIPADQGKRITSISINNAGPGIANIMALSGAAVVSSSAVAAVPSLSECSLLLLGLLAAGLGMRRLRRP